MVEEGPPSAMVEEGPPSAMVEEGPPPSAEDMDCRPSHRKGGKVFTLTVSPYQVRNIRDYCKDMMITDCKYCIKGNKGFKTNDTLFADKCKGTCLYFVLKPFSLYWLDGVLKSLNDYF